MLTDKQLSRRIIVAYFILGILFVFLLFSFNCSKRHRPPTTQPVMPTLDEARKVVPNPPRTTTQPDSTTGYTLIDLYILGAREAPYGGQGNMLLLALYRGPGTLAQDVTDQENHRPYILLMGDANLDGEVDVVDLGILSGNYGKQIDLVDPNSHPWSCGDFNFDGVVDISGLGALAGNYGRRLNDE